MTETKTEPWQDRLGFSADRGVVHKVGDRELKFHPISVDMLLRLRTMAKPIASAFSVLFSGNDKDRGVVQRDNKTQDTEGTVDVHEFVQEAVSPELARLRHEQKQKAITDLVDAITSDEGMEGVGRAIMDSLKDTFPRNSPTNPPAKEFITQIPLPLLPAMLTGLAKANKGVLGPLEQALSPIMDQVGKAVAKRVKDAAESKQQPVPAAEG